ncbi:MAG: hypothetical protein LBU18_02630 [Treponema sp.]|nr:hypothetical protein [Treponema sp.]
MNYITAGINNVFTINMAPVTPQWNTSANAITSGGATDFAFSAASTSSGGYNITVSLGNRYVHISPGTEAEPDSGESDNAKKPIPSSSAVFTVKYGLSKLAPLLAAEKSTDSTPTDSGAVTFANRRVRIKALDNKDTKYFAAIKLDAATGTSSGDNILHTSGKFTLPTSSVTAPYIAFFNSPSGTTDNLPGNNKDGHLLFELDYYAFGTKDSGGELWTIRNGLNSNEDYASLNATDLTGDTDGGAIHLVFGAGDPDEVEYKTVQLKNPSQE